MTHTIFVLLIDETSAEADPLRRALTEGAGQFRVQCVDDVPTALARIGGGGVDIAIMRLRPSEGSADAALDGFLALRAGAPEVPAVVVCDSVHADLGQKALNHGAAYYVIHEACDADLLKALLAVMGSAPRTTMTPGSFKDRPTHPASIDALARFDPDRGSHPPGSSREGKVVAFMGAKGGVGTTTLAVNVASVLAEDHSIILAEFHSILGTLPDHFQRRRSHDLSQLLKADAKTIDVKEAEACLWPCNTVAGLRILFGSRSTSSPTRVGPQDVKAILAVLRSLAECVVVDLPSSLSETTQAVMEEADLLTLVVERDPVCVQSAKRVIETMETWTLATVATGIAIVNRAALASPKPIAEIDHELSVPVLGVIPPAPDLCAAAQSARAPLVFFDADSLPAIALRDLAKVISGYIPAVRRGRPATASTHPSVATR